MIKYFLVLYVVLSIFLHCQSDEDVKKLPLRIYYEAKCRDSVHFFNNHLNKLWMKRQKYIDLKLDPFGEIDDANFEFNFYKNSFNFR